MNRTITAIALTAGLIVTAVAGAGAASAGTKWTGPSALIKWEAHPNGTTLAAPLKKF